MRMDVSGVIYVALGVLGIGIASYAFVHYDSWWLAGVGTFISFLSWMFLLTGANNLLLVYKDKRDRRPKMVEPPPPAKPSSGIPPQIEHPGIQEPKP